MIQTEVERIFSSKLVKNGGSFYIVIPKSIIIDYSLGLNKKERVLMAYIKRVIRA